MDFGFNILHIDDDNDFSQLLRSFTYDEEINFYHADCESKAIEYMRDVGLIDVFIIGTKDPGKVYERIKSDKYKVNDNMSSIFFILEDRKHKDFVSNNKKLLKNIYFKSDFFKVAPVIEALRDNKIKKYNEAVL